MRSADDISTRLMWYEPSNAKIGEAETISNEAKEIAKHYPAGKLDRFNAEPVVSWAQIR